MAVNRLGIEFLDMVRENVAVNAQEFCDKLNPYIIKVEMNDLYSTAKKLKIFSLFTMLSNCDDKERIKYAKKLSKLL